MKHSLYLLLILLVTSAQVFAGRILGAASSIVHGAADVATGATDVALNTVGTVLGSRPRVEPVVVVETPVRAEPPRYPPAYEEEDVTGPLDYEEDMDYENDDLYPEEPEE